MPRQLLGTAIAANTITTTQLQTTVVTQIQAGGSGPRVSSLIYPGDDTAANTVGGQTVYVVGSGFDANANVYINGNAVPSISFISASNLAITTPALASATYPVYVINPETGATAIHIPGLRVSGDPTWVTAAGSLTASQDEASAWSYTVSANSDSAVTYALAGGSSLPTGISLAANGLISGTLSSPPGTETTYNFTVVANDAENQSASRAFSVTVTTGEGVLFANNVLLIHADGTNNKNNHTFLDSSNNNLTITRNGNATQGSFSPFSQTGWSNYFDGSGDQLAVNSMTFSANAVTVEAWVYFTADSFGSFHDIFIISSVGMLLDSGRLRFYGFSATTASATITRNKWVHVAVVKESNNTLKGYYDGVECFSTTSSTVWQPSNQTGYIGSWSSGSTEFFPGYISNLRLSNVARYTSNFTPPTSPFSSDANTILLSCQSNRFIDNSNNNFAITRNGDVSVQAFSPFAPTAAYSTANVGGSGYFDGTDDYLTWSGTTLSGDFTVECWVYKIAVDASGYTNVFSGSDGNHQLTIDQTTAGSISLIIGSSTIIGASGTAVTPYAWHHLAWVREGSTCRVYVNGVQQGSGTSSTSFAIGTIGRFYGGGYEMNGYISGARIVAGTCLYPSGTTFTVPTSPPTNVANTSLLCNFTNAGIFDQTAKNVLETVGDAKVSTTQYKYGTASMYFDGTGDYLTTPPSIVNEFGSSDFTIEGWLYNLGYSGSQYGRGFFAIYPSGSYASSRLILRLSNTSNKFNLYWAVGGTAKFGPSGTESTAECTPNTWVHFAFTRQSGTFKFYVNGTLDTTISSVTDSLAGHNKMDIGRCQDGTVPDWNGYIDDLRITKGYARYTSTFTPPTAAFKDK